MSECIIETSALTKSYHGKTVVDHIDLHIPECAIYGFLGPNGAGKSTTMKMLLGLTAPDSGRIQVDGKEMNDKNRVSILKHVGSLIESPAYYGNLTAYENLQISCMLRGLPYKEIDRVLSIVRLDGQKKKKTAHYSLGMKQRLGLANALLGSPRLILLDEPTNGLDPSGIHEMRELIKSLPKQYGMTVMISSHLLPEIEQTADYIGVISRGQLIFQDTLSALQSRSIRCLCLRTSDDNGAMELLKEAPWRQEHNICESWRQKGASLPWLSDRVLAELLRKMWNRGIDIYRIEEKTQSLEDIYLEMVKEAGL